MAHWSKSQSNVALSSAEAELNATVKGLSEIVGLHHLIEETQGVTVTLNLCTDASACKGMLLRHGTGKVKHLSVKQLWAQECVKSFNIEILRVPREDNPADILTHCVSHPVMERHLEKLDVRRGRQLKELQTYQFEPEPRRPKRSPIKWTGYAVYVEKALQERGDKKPHVAMDDAKKSWSTLPIAEKDHFERKAETRNSSSNEQASGSRPRWNRAGQRIAAQMES